MWIVIAIAILIGGAQFVKAFRTRHEPEPPNSRLKLPAMIALIGGCVALAIIGGSVDRVVFSILAVVPLVQIGFILADRNPWWMQAAIDKREYVRDMPSPPRDLDKIR